MIEKITSEELEFMEDLYNPIVLTENLFSDVDNLALLNVERNCHIRMGQFPLFSFEYLIDKDPKLSDKENFKLREGAGNCWALGGRKFGKTMVVEILDTLISMVLLEAEHAGLTSLDALHIRGIIEKIILALESHPFFSMYKAKINRSPNYRITLNTGYLLESVNMNITGKNPGAQFFQKHFTRIIEEEASFETEAIYNKRLDSISENGCVMRVAGMTNFTKYSPCGRIFYDLSKRPWVLNLPQYVNPKWDEKEEAKAVKEHGGKSSISYRIFVKGEVVEEGISVFDMERVRLNYLDDRQIKHIEITKDKYPFFKDYLIVERPKNCEKLYIASDIGESAPSELAIFSQVDNKYKYIYNITLYGLTDKEQFAIFEHLGRLLEANFIALDTTEGTARSIYRSLEIVFTKDHLVWVNFGEKIPVGFEKDDKGNVVYNKSLPAHILEYVTEWSIKRLKELLYEGKFILPLDYKLDMQLNSVLAMQSGNRILYTCVADEDHLLSAFRVFAIAEWFNQFNLMKPIRKKQFSKSGF